MVKILFEVDRLVIACIMQQNGIKDFGISSEKWNRILQGVCRKKDMMRIDEFRKELDEEQALATTLKETVEKKWRQNEQKVLAWLKELTRVDFRESTIRVCVVAFRAGQVPFRDIPLIVVGRIREGWGYPETITHELAHVLFNQNFRLPDEVTHPYVQLMEEEIAVRLGVRAKYFDYDIPAFAEWVRKARQKEKAWKQYLLHIKRFKDISQFIRENEEQAMSAV